MDLDNSGSLESAREPVVSTPHIFVFETKVADFPASQTSSHASNMRATFKEMTWGLLSQQNDPRTTAMARGRVMKKRQKAKVKQSKKSKG